MSTSPEDAVRRYLAWVEDPDSVVDVRAVEAAEAAFASATDPIAKLHAAAARERAATADGSALERDFVAHAKAYADAHGIPASAFTALGVGADVLARAGFAAPVDRRRAPRRGRPAPAAVGARAPQVSVSRLAEVAMAMEGRFTLAQVAERAGGGSPATVRKAVEELIARGQVIKLGPAIDHHGPGRAPVEYEARHP